LTFGIVLCTAVSAAEANNESSTNSASLDNNSEWVLPPEGADALADVYLSDLKVIAHTYGYLLTGNETQKERLLSLQTDSDGSINRNLDTLDRIVADSPQAQKDYQTIYDAWDTMNASIMQVISSFEENGSPNKDDLAVFEQASVNLTDAFDRFGLITSPIKTRKKYPEIMCDWAGSINSRRLRSDGER
jgi:hypothetical protein